MANEKTNETNICCLCGKSFDGWGNNPYPLGDDNEVCCDACNNMAVIPARIARLVRRESIGKGKQRKTI